MDAFRHIRQNTEKAGINQFSQTNYECYHGSKIDCDTEFAISVFGGKKELFAYLNEQVDDQCMELDERRCWNDEDAAGLIRKIGKAKHVRSFKAWRLSAEIINACLGQHKTALRREGAG